MIYFIFIFIFLFFSFSLALLGGSRVCPTTIQLGETSLPSTHGGAAKQKENNGCMKLSQPSLFGEGEDRGGALLPALCAGCGEAKGPWLCTGCKLPDAPSFSFLLNIFFYIIPRPGLRG